MAVKILAADDSVTMRKVLELTFAGESVEVETVDSGEAAVERAQKSPPDLVIADASMSMDGYEVARALKSNPTTSNVAVIVLASQHHPFDAAKGSGAGVDDHILKPYDTQAMIDKTKEVLSKPRAAASAAAGAAAAPPAPPAPPKPPARPGVGRPAAKPGGPRSTVAFGAMPPKPGAGAGAGAGAGGGRPVLELSEEEPPAQSAPAASRPLKPAVPPVSRAAKPAAPKPSRPLKPATPARPAAPPKPAEKAAPAAQAAAAATASGGEMAGKLAELGLTKDQVEGVLGLSREVIERVVWEVVPDLAEVIIREEIRRLTAD